MRESVAEDLFSLLKEDENIKKIFVEILKDKKESKKLKEAIKHRYIF